LDASGRQDAWAAGATAALAIAFQTAGKATRDAIFLSAYPITALPAMMVAAAGASVLVALAAAWGLSRAGPRQLVPSMFVLSAVLLLGEWWLTRHAGRLAAILFYLHYSAFGAMLVSGLWSIVGERFDPRAARREIGRIGAAGAIGGVVGGLLAVRAGSTLPVFVMLPLLAAFHLGAASFAVGVGRGIRSPAPAAAGEATPVATAARLPYLRLLVALVLLTTIAEALLDYVFKARVTGVFGAGVAGEVGRSDLLRFFAWFYTITGLIAFAVQALASAHVLRRLGFARTAGALPIVTAVGGGGALLLPGLAPIVAARGLEMVTRSSLYRSGYELLFAPLLPAEKRASKAVVDVGVTRLGDALGAAAVRVALMAPAALQVLLGLTVMASAAAAVIVYRLQRGYARALERALAARAGLLEAVDIEFDALQSAMLHTVGGVGVTIEGAAAPRTGTQPVAIVDSTRPATDRRTELRSRDAQRVHRALRAGPVTKDLVHAVIPLLAWDAVATAAVSALRAGVHETADPMLAALRDPDEEFAVRRRLPIALAAAPTQTVADGLVAGLEDARFEVRYRCGVVLNRIVAGNPQITLDQERILRAVEREVSVDRRVWESHRLLDEDDDEAWSPMFDAVLKERASRALAHVFTMLALVLPRRPLQLAFRALHVSDPHVRGTALEYLETTLPESIRRSLWGFLEDTRTGARPHRSRDAIVRDLLASDATIALDLKRLRRRTP
jgi:ATP:ADP antiporter, AAA family